MIGDKDPLLFDIYTINKRADGTPYVAILCIGITLPLAQILSAADRDGFNDGIMFKGWVGTCPGWYGFKPLVVMPHESLIRNDQFKYLIELAG